MTGPWRRPDGGDLARRGEGAHPLERVEVGAELAVRVATTVVPRPSTMSPESSARSAGTTNDIESAVWPGWRPPGPRSPSTSTTSPSASPSAPKQYAGSRARTPQPFRVANSAPPRSGRSGGGSAARRATSPASSSTASRWPSSIGPRVDDDRPGAPGSREHPACWCRRGSSCPGFGASTQRARSPNVPPAQASLMPGRATRASERRCSGTSTASTPSPQRLHVGREHLDGPAVRRVEHVGGGGVLRDLEAR